MQFSIHFTVGIPLWRCKGWTKLKQLKTARTVTAWRSNMCWEPRSTHLPAQSLADSFTLRTAREAATAQLPWVKGSDPAQRHGHTPKARPLTQDTMSTHRNQEKIFLALGCSITKNNVRECIQASRTRTEKVTDSYVTASPALTLLAAQEVSIQILEGRQAALF